MWRRGKNIVVYASRPIRGEQIRLKHGNLYNHRQQLMIQSLDCFYNFHRRAAKSSASADIFPIRCSIHIDEDDNNYNIKRKLRLVNRSNVQDRHYTGKLYYRLDQSRCNSNSINSVDTPERKSITVDKTAGSSDNTGKTNDTKSCRNTDPAFASYLTGEIKSPSILDELTKLTASSVLNQRRTAAAKRSRSLALDTNNDKEIYRQIINTQILQKEKSHRKTAINVNRALIGNVIICTGMSTKYGK
jgi:hypothetical protein